MSKKYTLTGAVTGGMFGGSYRPYWTSFYDSPVIGYGYRVGKDDNYWRCANILFDESDVTLAHLRGVEVTSIKLTLNVWGRLAPVGDTGLAVRYKLTSFGSCGSASDATKDPWASSNADSTVTAADNIAYITSGVSTGVNYSGDAVIFDLTSGGIPVYGYTLGATSASISGYITVGATATLEVETAETDAWARMEGIWRQVTPWRNDGGVWRKPNKVWTNIGGVWKTS